MKKALVIFFGTFLITAVSLAQGQEQGDARLHVLSTYGLRWNNFGVGAGIEYFFCRALRHNAELHSGISQCG